MTEDWQEILGALRDPDADQSERAASLARIANRELYLIIKGQTAADDTDMESLAVEGHEFIVGYLDEVHHAQGNHSSKERFVLTGAEAASLLAQQELGLALLLDMDVEPVFVTKEELSWVAETIRTGPSSLNDRPTVFEPVPDNVIGLSPALSDVLVGVCSEAYLVSAGNAHSNSKPMIAILGKSSAPNDLIAEALNEAVSLSGIDAGEVLIGFFSAAEAAALEIRTTGLALDLTGDKDQPRAPGSDPTKPPRLI